MQKAAESLQCEKPARKETIGNIFRARLPGKYLWGWCRGSGAEKRGAVGKKSVYDPHLDAWLLFLAVFLLKKYKPLDGTQSLLLSFSVMAINQNNSIYWGRGGGWGC